MDITLPDTSRLLLTRRIRTDDRLTVVVVLTAQESSEHGEAAVQAGADYFLRKGTASGADILALVNAAFPVACD